MVLILRKYDQLFTVLDSLLMINECYVNLSLSLSLARFTGSFSLQGTPCEWDWEMLAGREVTPPFTPKLVSQYNIIS